MGEDPVPGGQDVEVPPQHAHRNPSIAQYFQYSQFSGPGVFGLASAALARLPRSTGSSGSSAAPVKACPSTARRLRLEVRFAREREDFSNNRSNACMPYLAASGREQLPRG